MKTLRHAVALLVPVLLAFGAAAMVVVLRIARRVVMPAKRAMDIEILAVDTGAQTIDLTRNADTELPGRYGLFTTGTYAYVKLGTVLSTDAGRVRRKLLTKIESGSKVDRAAGFSGWYYTSPEELHLPWRSVLIGTPAGANPAWLFPASADTTAGAREDPASGPAPARTWAIHVHGRGATRAECLRAVPVLHALGISNLVVSYRNDGEAPRSRGGAYALGAAEWRDVDAAIDYALRHGAEQVVLVGWSMGGAVALQAVMSSARREAIVGLILESPVIDWRSVLRYQARLMGVRDPLPSLAMGALSAPFTARLSGAEAAIPFDQLDMVARAAELTVPTLILHSDDDGFVPADASHALRDARPDTVTMVTFTGARHTKIWNYDQTAWTAAITDWVRARALSA